MGGELPDRFSGGCACSDIRYVCTAAPTRMLNCHCRDCQRAGGAGASPTLIVPLAAFAFERGTPRYHESRSEAGNVVRRGFCGRCGSPLVATSSARPARIAIRAGSLDDPSWFRPSEDVWLESAQPWSARRCGGSGEGREP